MLVREQPATELTIATRILSRAGALASDGRITLRLGDVLYVGARGASLSTITPYDIAVVLVSDGSALHGMPPDDLAAYLDEHRRTPGAASVVRLGEREYLSASSLRSCVVAALRRARGEDPSEDGPTIERVWTDLVTQARISGALIGAFATDEETP